MVRWLVVEEAGQLLKRARERLQLRYRDVAEASHRIANQRGNDAFIIGLSRLADIEHKGTVPSPYRIYTLCAIYGIDFPVMLQWYGIPLAELPGDAAALPLPQTRVVDIEPTTPEAVDFPVELGDETDFRRTFYLSRYIQEWGKLPVALFAALNLKQHRYAFLGTDDWSMYPLIPPGSFLQIDEARTRVAKGGWTYEHERPMYFVEHHNGYRCGWCTEAPGLLIMQFHAASQVSPEMYKIPGEAEIIGQVVAVAMRLDLGQKRRKRS